ncbi:MAG TPA: Ni/Fe hydrogenase subunit gamma [Chloroflexi bacterium]|nr:Ni/Fe hydrogenase subunit gamma [Chloroflexota bacterium]
MNTIKKPAAVRETAPLTPHWAEVVEITPEAEGISTYWLHFQNPEMQAKYRFLPGQFNMVYLPGYGEAAISISSDPADPAHIGHTIRFVGNVTRAVSRLRVGDVVGLRGPFGAPWPMDELCCKDVIIAAGGIGLAPLRPVIYHILNHRADYGKVYVLYGARTPKDLLYTAEYEAWQAQGVQVVTTVDRADEDWLGQVGVVPMLFYRFRMDAPNSAVLTCGPEIMIRFVVFEGLARRVPADHIYVSLERNMKCGQGSCGHCQLGPYFICKDGPVFRFDALEQFFNVEEF